MCDAVSYKLYSYRDPAGCCTYGTAGAFSLEKQEQAALSLMAIVDSSIEAPPFNFCF
jgi:hypothetical protein